MFRDLAVQILVSSITHNKSPLIGVLIENQLINSFFTIMITFSSTCDPIYLSSSLIQSCAIIVKCRVEQSRNPQKFGVLWGSPTYQVSQNKNYQLNFPKASIITKLQILLSKDVQAKRVRVINLSRDGALFYNICLKFVD